MTGGHRCMGSTKTPGTEVCNGLDDDCDGKVDELDSMSNKTSDDKLVYFAGKNVTMFAYEASRYDASATNHGFDSTRRPCAVAGRQPWSNITKEEAQAACEKIGPAGASAPPPSGRTPATGARPATRPSPTATRTTPPPATAGTTPRRRA